MADKSNITPYIPKLDLFLDVNMPRIEHYIEQLRKEIGLRQNSQIKALKLLLCNLYIEQDREIMLSRKKQSLGVSKYNPLGIGYRGIISALDSLHHHNWIIQVIGIPGETLTTMKATPKLHQWFEDTGWSEEAIDVRCGQFITLRKNKKVNGRRVYIDYQDTVYSNWLRKELKKYNELLNNNHIFLEGLNGEEGKVFKHLTLQRKFIRHKVNKVNNGEFIFSGRMPGPWTNISEEDRKRILINGEPTIELDREASHLNAMYQVVTGKPYPYGDAYEVSINGLKVPRHIIKKFSNFMQGGKSARGTAQSVINNYKNESELKEYEEYLEIKKTIKPTDIVKAILKKHPKIAPYYLRGKEYGDYIRCWESDIVFEVVMELTKREIPCLTVYDSFIVPLQYKQLVDNIKDITPYINRRKLDKVLV